MGERQYLGDGVYVAIDKDMIRLTTEDGFSTTNAIYLEPEVWTALLRYVATAKLTGPTSGEVKP